jgi:hypothetical protein
MRDEHDTFTIGIGAIEPLPGPAPARLTEPQRRAAQGYLGPKQRDGCHNCRSFDLRVQAPDTLHERLVTMCRRGNFRCERSGACTHWSLDTKRARLADMVKTPCARAGVYSAEDEAADKADFAKLQQDKADEAKAIARRAATLRGATVEPAVSR